MKKIFSCIAAVWMLASCDPVTDPVKATGIEIRPSSVTLEVGKTEELTFAVLPEQAVQKVLWESSNEKIVTVKEGKVTAIAAGKAEVKAVVAENKSLTAVCTVTVTAPVPETTPVTGLTPTPAVEQPVSLTVGGMQAFSVAVVPEDASNPAVNWSVDNGAVTLSAATGTSVTVTAASAGTAVVTAVSADNSEVSVSWKVTVTEPVPEEKPVTGLTPTPAVDQPVSLTVGKMQTFSVAVVPEDASNPAVNWSVDNGAVTLSAETGTSVTVTAASAGTAVVTAVSADNSKVSVSWTVTVTDPVPETTPVTGLTPTPAVDQPVSLTVGGTQIFGVAVVPEDASNPAVNWSVNNGAVTLSDATGTSVTVTADSAGTAVVTAVSADNSEVSVSWTVTVTEPVPESLNLEQDVPDAAFRDVLTKFDANSDGIVSRAEADEVKELNLEWDWSSTKIQNLQGIAFFSEIEILNAAYQNLQTVDLSGNKKLKRVNLEFNYIRKLDLSNQTELISSETSGSATYYGLQVGYQKKDENDYDGNASITVTLPSSKESLWNETWSKNKENEHPVNKGVTVTFR